MQKKITPFSTVVSAAFLVSVFSVSSFALADTAQNPIANPGLETADPNDASFPAQWKQGFWGANNAVFTYPVSGANGTKAAQVEITAYESGDAKWFFTDVPAIPGERFIFSGQYLANVPADVVVRYTLQDGNYRYAYLGTSVVSMEWTGYETLAFTVPANTVSLTVFHLIHETGSLAIDNVSLRPLEAAKTFVENTPARTAFAPGGAVPLSYIASSTPRIPPLPQENTLRTTEEPTVIDTVLQRINDAGTLTYTRTAQAAEPDKATAADFLSKPAAAGSFKASVNDFPEYTMLFLGLSLIFASLCIPILTSYQNDEGGKEEQLWEP